MMSKMDSLQNALEVLKDCDKEAQECGQPVMDVLSGILQSINSTTRLHATAQRCLMLKEQANEAITTYPYAEVPEHWRKLYMDATLLHVISFLSDESKLLLDNDLLELVRLLDMANIVTAYFDRGREEVLFSLLALIQSELSSVENENASDTEPPAKKQRRHGKSPASVAPSSDTPILLSGIQTIATYSQDNAPDMSELSTHTEPFIIKGAVLDWPAITSSETAWSDSEYLLKVAGRGRIVPVEIGSSYTAEGWTQRMMRFEEFLEKIRWDEKNALSGIEDTPGPPVGNGDEEPVLYLAQHDLFQQFPSLSADIYIPDYVFADPGPPSHFPEYEPPNVPAGYTKNAWMGPKQTYSPAHTDPYYNCYAQVVGSKHIWVAPPRCTSFMDGRYAVTQSDGIDDGRNAAAQQFMDNTAQIDVFKVSLTKPGSSSCSVQKQLFQKEVLPLARQAILEEGDLLFMPPKWWHSLKSLERSFSVSMWF